MTAVRRPGSSSTGRLLAALLIAALTFCALTFAASILLAEVATHPLVRRRPSDTAALSYSIAASAGGTARKISLRTKDGVPLNAWWFTPAHSNGAAVMVCHGVADSAYGVLAYALLFLRHGYSVLAPESRGHGESGGFVTYGVQEAADTVRWEIWLRNAGATDTYGFGESLGGAILIQSLAKGARFRTVIAEASYSSFGAVAEERMARFVPKPIAIILVREGLLYVRIRYAVDLTQARTDAALAHTRTPVLLIHGLADNETDPTNSKKLALANTAITTLWLVPGAPHVGAYSKAPKVFEEKVLQWFSGAGQQVQPVQ